MIDHAVSNPPEVRPRRSKQFTLLDALFWTAVIAAVAAVLPAREPAEVAAGLCVAIVWIGGTIVTMLLWNCPAGCYYSIVCGTALLLIMDRLLTGNLTDEHGQEFYVAPMTGLALVFGFVGGGVIGVVVALTGKSFDMVKRRFGLAR